MEHLEGLARGPVPQDLVELVQDAGGAALDDLPAQEADGLGGVAVDGESQARGQGRGPQHADGVLAEAHRRIADGADHAVLQVEEAVHVVDHREGGDVVEQGVDREVAAEGVLLGRAEGVVAPDEGVALFGLGLAPEGRDLHHLPSEADVAEPEAAADHEAVAEEPLDLLRVGAGADVEVLGLAAQQQVAHPAAHQVGHVTAALEAVQDLQGVRVDGLAGDRVLRALEDARRHFQGGRGPPHGDYTAWHWVDCPRIRS